MINLINFKCGHISTMDRERESDIIVRSPLPNTFRDGIIGGAITLAGIGYLLVTAFKNGANAHDLAEFNTLDALGLIGRK